MQQLIGPFTQLLPMTDLPLKGSLSDKQLTVIEQGGIRLSGGKIKEVGIFNEMKHSGSLPETTIHHITKPSVCLPGFIDSHTHICWGGSRANDFAMRNAGKTYLEIAREGGGIKSTVQQTRNSSQTELVQNIVTRASKLLNQGITTVEVKSGYGLSVTEELKMLRAIDEANSQTNQHLISTCLAAHTLPKDFDGNHSEYLKWIENELFPVLVKEKLTTRIDAFIEEEAFNESAITPYFKKANELGFQITVHADQFSTGGSKIAVEHGAVSADHLEASGAREIELLANSNTVATALPGASIGLGAPFTPARKLLDAGACVSIASDWNPGSAPQGDLLSQASVLATYQKLTNAEVLAGITTRAAHALRKQNTAQITPGFKADFITFPTTNYQEITYQMGQLKPDNVWIDGKTVYQTQNT